MADPGWYPDPGGGDGLRWFDGAQWTSSTMGGPSEAPTPPAVPGSTIPPPPPPPAPPAPPATGRRRRGGTAMALLGLALVAIGMAVVVPGCVDQFSGPRIDVPGQRTVELDDGTWTIHQRVDGSPLLGPGDLVVSGEDVEVRSMGFSETLSINEVDYVGIARLEVGTSGPVTIGTGVGGEPSQLQYSELLVTRGFAGFGRLVGWTVAAVVGVVLIVLGLVRRSRRAR